MDFAALKTLIPESEIRNAISNLAERLNADYAARSLTLIGVMTGSIVFMADLIRLMKMPLRVGVIQASSYRSGTTRGELLINSDMMPDITGRNVLLVDDIFDTGHTLNEVVRRLGELNPQSIKTAVLLRKQGRREVEMQPDYVAFDIPDKFVVGYGLDFQDAYRNLNYIAALEAEDLSGS